MIALHFHLHPQYKYEIFHIIFTLFHLSPGSIDEVEQMVHMTWVQPRVLDLNQVNENTFNPAFRFCLRKGEECTMYM